MSVESGLGAPVEQDAEAGPPSAVRAREPLVAPSPRRRSSRRERNATRGEVAARVAPAPTPSFTRRGKPRRQGRRVRRVVRRIELWSVLKVSLAFYAIMLGVALASVALLWGLANTTGVVDDLEGFLRDSGFDDFRFQGDRMFRQVAFVGAVVALAFTVFTVLTAALINLISEITGGIRFVVIEEIVPATNQVAPATPPAEASRTSAAPLPGQGPDAPTPSTRAPSGPPPSWPGALPTAAPGRSGTGSKGRSSSR